MSLVDGVAAGATAVTGRRLAHPATAASARTHMASRMQARLPRGSDRMYFPVALDTNPANLDELRSFATEAGQYRAQQ